MKQRLVIIPAHNEEQNLPGVLRELWERHPEVDVVVVDDGSHDRSGAVAKEAGAAVVTHPVNRGYGAALTTGYKYALDHGYPVVVRMDADGQHDPADLDRLFDCLRNEDCDIAIGSRGLSSSGYRPSLPRRVGIAAFGWLGKHLTGGAITDPTSGYAAMNRRATAFLVRHTPVDFPDLNVRVAMHRAGLRAREVPVTMRARQRGESMLSGVRPFIYVPKMLWYIGRVYLSPPDEAQRSMSSEYDP